MTVVLLLVFEIIAYFINSDNSFNALILVVDLIVCNVPASDKTIN